MKKYYLGNFHLDWSASLRISQLSSKILRFFEKNNLAIHANAIWQRDLRLKTWSIVWPQQHSRIRIWDSSVQKDKVVHEKKTKSEFS